MTFKLCVSGLDKTSMNFTFTQGSYPQDVSLFIWKYSQIKTTVVKGYPTCKETQFSADTILGKIGGLSATITITKFRL